MPRVKIDYIVSFSNEDPEHPASTLLAWDVSKKKWLCSKGEPSCSVVLQLSKAVKISSVTIGSYQAALVEVLVGRSATPNDQYQVLVPSSVFQTPVEARRAAAEGAGRVRSFAGDALAAPARDQRWDRLRVVASQPYNKHCQFGLSFVHVFSEEVSPPAQAASPAPPALQATPALLPARLGTPSSDEEEFRPGELFKQHLQRKNTTDTGAQIRQATSHALKNIPDSSIKLSKTPLSKCASTSRNSTRDSEPPLDRKRESLMYSAEDDTPNKKVDAVIQRHQRDIEKQKPKDTRDNKGQPTNKTQKDNRDITPAKGQSTDKTQKDNKQSDIQTNTPSVDTQKDDKDRTKQDNKHSKESDRDRKQDQSRANAGEGSSRNTGRDERKQGRKRTRSRSAGSDNEASELRAGPISSSPHRLLHDVRFVLSGYENPRRASIRTAAIALGARCERDWGGQCTHLICAFPNTPKLRAVRASANGSGAVVVLGEWVEECARARRRLPWQWFATEPARRRDRPSNYDDVLADEHSECDTDDEIERVRQKMKKQRPSTPPASPPAASPPRASPDADMSANTDVMFVADQRIQGSVHVVESDSGGSTDEEAPPSRGGGVGGGLLPALLAGRRFAVQGVGGGGARVKRYLTAYGGLVLDDEDAEVDMVVCSGEPTDAESGAHGSASFVRAAWLWACHKDKRVPPIEQYLLS